MENKKNLSLSEAAKQAQREYKKKWRAKNPDKVRESNRKYWERMAEKMNKEAEQDANAND